MRASLLQDKKEAAMPPPSSLGSTALPRSLGRTPKGVLFLTFLLAGLHRVLIGLDHLLNHLTANGACLTGGELAVVAVLQVYANLGCSLHLEVLHSLFGFGDDDTISCHFENLLVFWSVPSFRAQQGKTDAIYIIEASGTSLPRGVTLPLRV